MPFPGVGLFFFLTCAPMPLPRDVARCHDRTCPLRADCRRWLDRHIDGDAVHVQSLRDTEESCEHQLKA
jgi:hypothetical protein